MKSWDKFLLTNYQTLWDTNYISAAVNSLKRGGEEYFSKYFQIIFQCCCKSLMRRGGGELIYFFLAPFHNQLKRQRGGDLFQRRSMQKKGENHGISRQSKASGWWNLLHFFGRVQIALVLSILLIKNYGGYGDEENIEYMMICRISFQICFEHQLKRLGFKIYLQKLVLAIWEFHLIQTARMKDIASPSKDSHQDSSKLLFIFKWKIWRTLLIDQFVS